MELALGARTDPIVLIGAAGGMGKRYHACLTWLGYSVIDIDLGDKLPTLKQASYKRALVCTPTDTHVPITRELVRLNYDTVLVEKPVSMDVREIRSLNRAKKTRIKMVCNWRFLIPNAILMPGTCEVYYNYYNMGAESIGANLIQPLYLAKEGALTIGDRSPVFNVQVNGYPVTQAMVDMSYLTMLQQWISQCYENLWGLGDAIAATDKAIKLNKELSMP